MPNRKRAFTLIELLVVVAIILALLAILMPSMGRAVELAQETQCASNLHQQAIGMTTYVSEFFVFPAAHSRSSAGHVIAPWVTRIREFSNGSRDAFYCPAEPPGWKWQEVYGSGSHYATASDAQNFAYDEGELLMRVAVIPFSYGYNDWGASPAGIGAAPWQRGLGGDIGFAYNVPHVSMSQVVSPSQMVAIADNLNTGSWRFNIDPTNPNEYPSDIHRRGANFVFADGHVQWRLQEEMVVNGSNPDGWSGRDREIARIWNSHNHWDPRP